MRSKGERVLIVGRSPSVLVEAVDLLRDRGYGANASNQFDSVIDDYDMREVDLVIFGGMVPPQRKIELREEIGAINPKTDFMQGLGGIPKLLVAQVEELTGGAPSGVEYDERRLRITLTESARVIVEGIWGTFVPPEPVSHSLTIVDGELEAGVHEIPIPGEIPAELAFVAVRIADQIAAIQIGETPQSLSGLAAAGTLPPPTPVTTHFAWA